MKTLFRICLLLFSTQWLLSCSEERGKEIVPDVESIPSENRFIFKKGDLLLYKCSDGSIDSIYIKDFSFSSEHGSGYDMFGGMHTYIRDYQKITIECSNDKWRKVVKDYLSSNDPFSNCFMIETINTPYLNGDPHCWIINGCIYTSGLPIITTGSIKYDTIILNNKSYNKVYYYSKNDPNSYKIYWNLKYGIIHFEGLYNGKNMFWDLVGN